MPKSLLTEKVTSSKSDEWRTPPELFKVLDREFAFVTDAAASEANKLCPHYFGPDHPFAKDALVEEWDPTYGPYFFNPPFSRLSEFMYKALLERDRGNIIVALVPAKTETRWAHGVLPFVDEVRFLKRRVSYLQPDGTSPAPALFPSMVVIFDGTRPLMLNACGPRVSWWDWKEST